MRFVVLPGTWLTSLQIVVLSLCLATLGSVEEMKEVPDQDSICSVDNV